MAGMSVVVVGGGVAGIEAALGVRDLAGGLADVTIVTPQEDVLHQAHGDAPSTLGTVQRHPMPLVAERLGAALVRDTAVAVDAGARRVRVRGGADVAYDAVIVAVGARRVQSLDRAVGFGGPLDVPAVESVLEMARRGDCRRPAVVVPPAAAWSLPAYELALRAAAAGARPVVVTAERTPAEAFGADAAGAVSAELERAEVQVVTGVIREAEPGSLFLLGGGELTVDATVALPYLRGPRLEGLPADADGYLLTDAFARVHDVDAAFGAGDGTSYPIRQGGIASQQAAVAAAGVAALTGAEVTPEPLRPVLRGVLPRDGGALFLEHDLAAGTSRASDEPLWRPPHRVAGVRLPGFLDELARVG